jgi:hypothetical protein
MQEILFRQRHAVLITIIPEAIIRIPVGMIDWDDSPV